MPDAHCRGIRPSTGHGASPHPLPQAQRSQQVRLTVGTPNSRGGESPLGWKGHIVLRQHPGALAEVSICSLLLHLIRSDAMENAGPWHMAEQEPLLRISPTASGTPTLECRRGVLEWLSNNAATKCALSVIRDSHRHNMAWVSSFRPEQGQHAGPWSLRTRTRCSSCATSCGCLGLSRAACRPLEFENQNTLQQLRCGGVLEAVRISCAGFPAKLPFEDFVDHFWNLVPDLLARPDLDDAALARGIAARAGLQGYQIGRTKVIFSAVSSLFASLVQYSTLMTWTMLPCQGLWGMCWVVGPPDWPHQGQMIMLVSMDLANDRQLDDPAVQRPQI